MRTARTKLDQLAGLTVERAVEAEDWLVLLFTDGTCAVVHAYGGDGPVTPDLIDLNPNPIMESEAQAFIDTGIWTDEEFQVWRRAREERQRGYALQREHEERRQYERLKIKFEGVKS